MSTYIMSIGVKQSCVNLSLNTTKSRSAMWKCVFSINFLINLIQTFNIMPTQEKYCPNIKVHSFVSYISRNQRSLMVFHISEPNVVLHNVMHIINQRTFPLYVLRYDRKRTDNILEHLRWASINHITILIFSDLDFICIKEIIERDNQRVFKRGDYLIIANLCGSNTTIVIENLFLRAKNRTPGESKIIRKSIHADLNDTAYFTDYQRVVDSEKKRYRDKEFQITVFTTNTHVIRGGVYYGRDITIVKLILEHLKLRYRWISPQDNMRYGDEKAHTGAYGQLVRGEADISVNARIFINTIISDHVVEYNYPILRDDLVILIPKKHRDQKIFYLTKIGLSFIVITIIILYTYFKIFTNLSLMETILTFLLMCIGKPVKEINVKYFRIVYMSVMLTSFFGYTLFAIQLFSLRALEKRIATITSLAEFAQVNTEIITRMGLKDKVKYGLESDPLYDLIIPRIKIYNPESDDMEQEKELLKTCTDYAIICKSSTVALSLKMLKSRSKAFCYKLIAEPIMPSLVVYIMNYRNPFYKQVDRILFRIFEAGLTANYTYEIRKGAINYKADIKPMELDTAEMRNVWYGYISGMALSLTVFVVELAVDFFNKY